jgi:hypothetical protein
VEGFIDQRLWQANNGGVGLSPQLPKDADHDACWQYHGL